MRNDENGRKTRTERRAGRREKMNAKRLRAIVEGESSLTDQEYQALRKRVAKLSGTGARMALGFLWKTNQVPLELFVAAIGLGEAYPSESGQTW